MALTPQQIRQWIVNKLDTSVEPNWADQNDISGYRGLCTKYDYQLVDLKKMYKTKVPRLVQIYQDRLEEISSHIKNFDIPKSELKEEFEGLKSKVMRIVEKWLAVKREIEGREKGYFNRNPVGTTYYIDLVDGTDGPGNTVHDGLKEDNSGSNYTSTSGTDTTHAFIAQGALDNDTDDDYNGDWIYNVTRSAGAKISDYVGDDLSGSSVITHAEIASQTDTDTFYIIRAWLTIEQYTTTTGRSAGDIAYVRANTTESCTGTILFDEDGDKDNYISIIGCDATTNDPWNDNSDVKPIVSFGDTAARYFSQAGDQYWYMERIIAKESADATYGNFYFYHGTNDAYWHFKACEFTDNSHASGKGVVIRRAGHILFEDCVFKDNIGMGVHFNERSYAKFKGCTFDGGGTTQDYGINSVNFSFFECEDCDFGQTISHDTNDILVSGGSIAKLRDCRLDSALSVANSAVVFEEDADGTYGAGKITYPQGTVTKDTGVKTGNADFSLKFEPGSACGLYLPLTTQNNGLIEAPFVVEGTASSEITCTIPIRAVGTWSTYPTNTELYIEASYYDSGSDAGRSTDVSTEVLSHESDWVNFSTTCTPLRNGPIYINVYMKLYEDAGDGCYVNGEVTTS